MKRIVFAAAALLAVSVPAFAQYPGGYYGERGYGGYEDRGGSYGRRGYDPYEDDDYRPRRERRVPPRSYGNPYAGSPRAPQGRGAGMTCVTPRGACPVGVPTPVGTPCGCHAGGSASRGTVQ
jgi:hypothetical protein